jgi:hypothetical protein
MVEPHELEKNGTRSLELSAISTFPAVSSEAWWYGVLFDYKIC